MTFSEAYAELEHCFKSQVDADNKRCALGSDEGIYLPNIKPANPVDFVFVGMEPSIGRWAPDLQKAREMIDRGFKNFAWSIEDFILHFCIREYLCNASETYYITDVSKGAMKTRAAGRQRKDRYEDWYPLLQEELRVTTKPEARIISIGKRVGSFLSKKGTRGHVETILHYSQQANKHRGLNSKRQPKAYHEFSSSITLCDVMRTAEEVMTDAGMKPFIDDTLMRLNQGLGLTDSRKKLMFDYKVSFECVRR